MKLSRITTIALLVGLVAANAGCTLVNRVLAKNALNEGASAYRAGNFAEAEQKFRYAYELDPSQKNAPLFIARAVQQQYKPGVQTPENVKKGEDAIAAYRAILDKDPTNEDAYKAIVFLYGQMRNEDKVREMLTQRASLGSIPPEKRSEALTILASKQWQCAYDITEQKENKETRTETQPGTTQPKATVKYKKPANQADFDKARQCVTEGLKLAEQAVSLDEGNPNSWSYRANLLREAAKLAEMEGNAQAKADYEAQYEKALETHRRLSEEAAKKKEAEEAAKGAKQPAS
jgi:tetratricopeptide (TPR) repeat protein